jgi:hypothetical protein
MMGRHSGPEKTILHVYRVHRYACMRIIIHSGGGNGKFNCNYHGDHLGHPRKNRY